MIGSLTGVLSEIDADGEAAISLVVDVHGVGYWVVVGSLAAAALRGLGDPDLPLGAHPRPRGRDHPSTASPTRVSCRTFEVLLERASGVLGSALALGILSFPSARAALGERDRHGGMSTH